MRVTFLGGAEEIGASCALVELDGARLVVDCGQRLGASAGNALPDFSRLEGGPPIDAVIVTHAHADHVGALPALEPHLPKRCPILATQSTIALVKVMLQDSLRIMTRHRSSDGDLPLFPAASVPPTLERFQSVRWTKPVKLDRKGDVTATYYPAGHIVGAAMVEIKGRSGSIMMSGDVSVSDQLSVPGVFPPSIQPNVLVLEATYGNRLHAHRPAQERRIVDRVRETIAQGGSVLFPTFALGRAQEVLLILGRAMRDGSLPPVPVFADGLVRTISKVYSKMTEDLSPGCRRLWERGLDPIFSEDVPIRSIRDEAHRNQVGSGSPAVVVASSGMLQGGASQFYARKWIHDAKNLIMITGYQDEESPGQALLNLASLPPSEPRYFKLSGVVTQVACQVENCGLSAHADNGELVALASKFAPQLILPVHGDKDARESLARSLLSHTKAEVVLPFNGQTYGLTPSEIKGNRQRSRASVLNGWTPWDPATEREIDVAALHSHVTGLNPPAEWVTIDELADLWKAPKQAGADDLAAMRRAVYGTPQRHFTPDSKRPYILKPVPPENLAAPIAVERMPTERSLPIVREIFPATSGLRRAGFFPEESVLVLEFEFPRAAEERYRVRLSELRGRCGWEPSIAEETPADQDRVKALAAERLGVPAERITLFPNLLTARVHGSVSAEEAEAFQRRTGYKVEADA